MLICKTFPQVYNYFDRKTGIPYFQVSARSAKWGMHERKGQLTRLRDASRRQSPFDTVPQPLEQVSNALPRARNQAALLLSRGSMRCIGQIRPVEPPL
jgi:hypothetical protein